MSADFLKLQFAMKKIVKIAYEAQNENLSPYENEELDKIMMQAMDLGGAEDQTVSQFIDGVQA